MRSIQLLILSSLFGSPEFFLLEGIRSRFLDFFREKPLPGSLPAWRRKLPPSRSAVRPSRLRTRSAS